MEKNITDIKIQKVESMILEASRNHETDKVNTYRLLKAEYLKIKTAKNAKPLDDNAEISLINKMVKERKESEEIYTTNNRPELAQKERIERLILEELLPKGATDEDITNAVNEWLAENGPLEQKQMGICIKAVKEKLKGLNVDGSLLAQIVKSHIN